MVQTIALAGTLDSKGKEFAYVKELIESLGLKTFTIHTGVFNPYFVPDVPNQVVAAAAGADIGLLSEKKDRGKATAALSRGMEILLPKLYAEGKFDGILSLGGTGGTSMVAPGMRALPLGVPKVIVSTVASGNTEPYIGISDIMMIPSIVDVAGLNSISTKVFAKAVFAIAGMVHFSARQSVEKGTRKPIIGATMFGLTTVCVNFAKDYLEKNGYEVLVFHATGIGGRTLEHLVSNGLIDGVLDITTTEWADQLDDGILAAGPHRLEAAADHGVPQVVSVGALDMVNFGPCESVPAQYKGRNFYRHNPTTTLMRTTVAENIRLGRVIAEKLNRAQGGTTALLLPLQGVSGIDAAGQPFYGPAEDHALFSTLRAAINPKIVDLIEDDAHINTREFAELAAKKLLDLIQRKEDDAEIGS